MLRLSLCAGFSPLRQRGRCKRPFGRPSSIEASDDRVVLETSPTAPFSEAQGFAVQCDQVNIITILHLNFRKRPPDVSDFVVPVRINAIKGMLRRRARADVRQERLKVVQPFGTHAYSPTAIAGPSLVFRVSASPFHHLPGFVLGRRFSSAGITMRSLSISKGRSTSQAAARGLPSVKQVGLGYFALFAAVALAQPVAHPACVTPWGF